MIVDHAHPNGRGGILGRALACLALLAIACAPLHAQRFQYTFGDNSPNGEEGNAVIAAANGDIIAAGTAFTAAGNPQAYVIRTDANGNVAAGWHRLYDLNTARLSGATDIKEYPGGDLIAVRWGVTERSPCAWTPPGWSSAGCAYWERRDRTRRRTRW
jgi:hypothetical protein